MDDGYFGNYFKCLLFYNGSLSEDEVLNFDRATDLEKCTIGYAIGNWYLASGDKEKAMELFQKIVKTDAWQANGFIAAEAELSRLIEPTLK